MPQEILENDVEFGIQRGSINNNFTELYNIKLESTQVLTLTNAAPYTPTGLYHPTPKQYVDSIQASWQEIYNPQSINADIFNRENHTGVQPASSITQDLNNRFTTDAEKASWNNKEPAIGFKNTAFNVDFGTTSGTVATGDHTHTKADIGLGNVDNKSDLDKPISTATQTALDTKAQISNDYLVYNPLTTLPTYQEGLLFYNSNANGLCFYSDISGLVLNPLEDAALRVVNTSGALLSKGTPVYQKDISIGLAGVAPGIATGYREANILGLIAADIPIGGQGFILSQGTIEGIDLSSFDFDDRLFLSDTVAGGLTTDTPDISTLVGTVIDNAVSGKLLIRIMPIIALPTNIGFLKGGVVPTSITTTYSAIANYTSSGAVGNSVDETAGTIEVFNTGISRININCAISFTLENVDKSLLFQIWNVTDSVALDVIEYAMYKSQEKMNFSICTPYSVTAGKEYQLRLASSAGDSFAGVSSTMMEFDIESISVS